MNHLILSNKRDWLDLNPFTRIEFIKLNLCVSALHFLVKWFCGVVVKHAIHKTGVVSSNPVYVNNIQFFLLNATVITTPGIRES